MSDWILKWFQKRNPGVLITPETDYFKVRLIDSLGFIELIEDIENEYQVRLEFEELSQPFSKTIKGLSHLVEKKIKMGRTG